MERPKDLLYLGVRSSNFKPPGLPNPAAVSLVCNGHILFNNYSEDIFTRHSSKASSRKALSLIDLGRHGDSMTESSWNDTILPK
jgi:hypothetical protein